MIQKLLITGASGFVGYHLVRTAKSRGFDVHAAVRRSSNIKNIEQYVDKFVFPDFSDVDALSSLLTEESYDYIIHAAALTKAKREDDMREVNVDYTLNLIEAAFMIPNPPKAVHFVSSLAAVGPLRYDSAGNIDENTVCNPVTVYGRSKCAAELQIKERFAHEPIRVFRPTAVYGPHEKDIFILIKALSNGIDAYIGRKPQKLSFIYVQDLADVLIDSLRCEFQGVRFYNITDGDIYGRYEMADVVSELLKKRLFRFHVPYTIVKQVAKLSQWLYRSSVKTPVIYPERLNELTAENWACDISKAKAELGFAPKYSLKKGLIESLKWYKENHWL